MGWLEPLTLTFFFSLQAMMELELTSSPLKAEVNLSLCFVEILKLTHYSL